jgi:hypothetical protein
VGGGQVFWQAPEEDDEAEGDGGGWGWQQQQQQQQQQPIWQAAEGLASHPGQAHRPPAPATWDAAGGTEAGWQVEGQAADGDGGGGAAPWWARFPDFVPVAALQGGRDPRWVHGTMLCALQWPLPAQRLVRCPEHRGML